MTIAACYLSPEGLVLGADSTTTLFNPDGQPHFYNSAQKLFEIGQTSTLGIVTWGLGGLSVLSYRRLLAQLSDDLARSPPASVRDAADRWAAMLWPEYQASEIVQVFTQLATKGTARSPDEESAYRRFSGALNVGFCIGGYVGDSREPCASVIAIDALQENRIL